jgi:hypothetical protein
MTRTEWLTSLKIGDTVVPYIHSNPTPAQRLTHVNDKWVTIGKYGKAVRYRRSDGALCGHKRLGHLFRIEPPAETLV